MSTPRANADVSVVGIGGQRHPAARGTRRATGATYTEALERSDDASDVPVDAVLVHILRFLVRPFLIRAAKRRT